MLADQLKTPNDLYYGIYGALAIGFLALWAHATELPWRAAVRRRGRLTILLAVGCAGVLAFIVLGQDATNRPGGAALIGAVLWRGVFYGAIDGLLLSSFPVLATFAAFKDSKLDRRGLAGSWRSAPSHWSCRCC